MDEFKNKLISEDELEKYVGRGWFVIEKKNSVYLVARRVLGGVYELDRIYQEYLEDTAPIKN